MPIDIQDHQGSVSEQFRARAGLPPRKNDKPTPADAEPEELDHVDGPEGGFGNAEEPEPEKKPEPKKAPAKKAAAKKAPAKKAAAKKKGK